MPRIFGGLKVWDASWVGVGPITARYFADHGATVVRTESSNRIDVLRNGPPFRDGVPGINRSQFFADYNASKVGVGVNFGTEQGHALGQRLGAWADVVIESFRPGAFDRMGFGYERLGATNAGLIMLSTSMSGRTGPRKDFAGFGTVLTPMSGFSELTGWPDRGPGAPYGAYTDFVVPRFAATAIIAALEHRRLTGQGQHIDLSQLEAGLEFLGAELLDYQLNGHVATRDGNRNPHSAPHGVFPCQSVGDREQWVAIAVESDEQWATLAEKLERLDWRDDPELADLAGRKRAEDRIEKEIAAWTAGHTPREVIETLQPYVPAGFVHDGWGLHQDAQIQHRHYFRSLRHTVMGETVYEGSAVELSRSPNSATKAAPCLGEDTREVLTTCLGYTDEEVDDLLEAGSVEIVLD